MPDQGLGENGKARDLLEAALASYIKNLGAEHPQVAAQQSNLSSVWLQLGDLERARELREFSMAFTLKNFGAEHPNLAIDQNGLGVIYLFTGEIEKAKGLFEQAYILLQKQLGEQHPKTQEAKKWVDGLFSPSITSYFLKLGSFYLKMGEKEKARGVFEWTYILFQKQFGEQHPKTQKTKKLLDKVR